MQNYFILVMVSIIVFATSGCKTSEETAKYKLERQAEREARKEAERKKLDRRITDKCILKGYKKNTENLSRCVRVTKEDYLEDLERYKSNYNDYSSCKRSYCLKSYARSNPRNPGFNCGADLVKKACGEKPIEPEL